MIDVHKVTRSSGNECIMYVCYLQYLVHTLEHVCGHLSVYTTVSVSVSVMQSYFSLPLWCSRFVARSVANPDAADALFFNRFLFCCMPSLSP